MATAEYPHISFDPEGVPLISGTRTKVVEVVVEHRAYGWDAGELQRQHPYLSLAQIHAALAYYYDHQAGIDADMERRRQRAEQIKAEIARTQGEPLCVPGIPARFVARLPLGTALARACAVCPVAPFRASWRVIEGIHNGPDCRGRMTRAEDRL